MPPPVGIRPKIGLISVYFGLFDEAMPPGFRADRETHPLRLTSVLERWGDVVYEGMVDSETAGEAVGMALADRGVDLVVCAPSMAAPPSYTMAALARVPGVPVVAVAAQEQSFVPDDYTTEEATRRSLPVGLVMATNVLVREGRPFLTVVGVLDDDGFAARLGRAVQAAAAAGALTAMRLLAVGDPIPGYDDVEASPQDLSRLGVAAVPVTPERLAAVFDEVTEEQAAAVAADAGARFDASAVPGPVLDRSARLAWALRRLCDEEGVAGGAVNCHGEALRWNPGVGITACLAVTELSARGRPFACTGDLPTAIALVLGKRIAGAALYCELYQLDVDADWLLVANGGEGDVEARDRDRPVRLLPEEHYSGLQGPGVAVAFALPVGPATLVSMSPAPGASGGWRLVTAEGSIIGSRHGTMEGPNGMFRFADHGVEEGYAGWCAAGATHHAAALPGHHAATLSDVARLLGISAAVV